jgi:hypothetical protein
LNGQRGSPLPVRVGRRSTPNSLSGPPTADAQRYIDCPFEDIDCKRHKTVHSTGIRNLNLVGL